MSSLEASSHPFNSYNSISKMSLGIHACYLFTLSSKLTSTGFLQLDDTEVRQEIQYSLLLSIDVIVLNAETRTVACVIMSLFTIDQIR